jgi:hypothetical protein
MDKRSDEHTNRYVMIELSCDQTQCRPCTYPNCQRYVRQQRMSKKVAATVKPISSKTLEINTSRESELKGTSEVGYPHHVNRYILTELSCTEAKCSPCTYPNCQRFVRSKKITGKKEPQIISVTELKGDKQLQEMIRKAE